MDEKTLKTYEALYTYDVILLQLGSIKDIKNIANKLNFDANIITIPDYFSALKEKYNISSYNNIKRLTDIKNIDFTQDLFYFYFESIIGQLQNAKFEVEKPNILVVERTFLDFMHYLASNSKLLYEINSILLSNYKLFEFMKSLMSYSFVRGIVNVPDLNDSNDLFYKKDFLQAAKNYLSFCNYCSIAFAHTFPINYDFYYTEEGSRNMLPILNYEIENNSHLDASQLSPIIDTLENSTIKDRYQKYLLTVPSSGNLVSDNFVWGQIFPTLLHFYTTKLSFMYKKEKDLLIDILKRVLSTKNSTGFLTLELKEAFGIATTIREEKKKQQNLTIKTDTKYIN